MEPNMILKSQKTYFGAFLFNAKKHDLPGPVLSRFSNSPGGRKPSKSSNKVIMVCENEGATYSETKQKCLRKI